MEELVKRLWECASGECFNCSQYTETTNASVCSKELMKQVANAIEELSKIREEQKAQIILMAAEDKPRWIPVTERLPEQNVPCIVYNKYYGPMVGWRVDGERFRIPGSRFPDHPTHWMPIPQPPKEET